MFRRSSIGLAVLMLLLMVSLPTLAQPKGGGNETGPYEVVPDWPQNPCGEGNQIGSVGGIFEPRRA